MVNGASYICHLPNQFIGLIVRFKRHPFSFMPFPAVKMRPVVLDTEALLLRPSTSPHAPSPCNCSTPLLHRVFHYTHVRQTISWFPHDLDNCRFAPCGCRPPARIPSR